MREHLAQCYDFRLRRHAHSGGRVYVHRHTLSLRDHHCRVVQRASCDGCHPRGRGRRILIDQRSIVGVLECCHRRRTVTCSDGHASCVRIVEPENSVQPSNESDGGEDISLQDSSGYVKRLGQRAYYYVGI